MAETKLVAGGKRKIDETSTNIAKAPAPKRQKIQPVIDTDGKKKYPCGICGKLFTRERSINLHVQAVHERKYPFVCTTCGAKFAANSHLTFHRKTVHERVFNFPCDVCTGRFPSGSELTRHKKVVHLQKGHVCPFCNRAYGVAFLLETHIARNHTKNEGFKCETCEKKFTQKGHLKKHRKEIHENKRDYVCDTCQQTFTRKEHMESHVKKVHENRRDHKCQTCDKAFVRVYDLQKHVRHVHEKIKKFTCMRVIDEANQVVCNQKFSMKGDFSRHVKTVHEKRRDFVCDWPECVKTYTSASILNLHRNASHTREKTWKCDKLLEDGKTPCNFQTWFGGGVLTVHIARSHGPKAMLKRKKKEHWVAQELQKSGVFITKRERQIDHKDLNSDAKFSRIDFDLTAATSQHVLFLEVDEFAHADRMVTCETRRMMDVVSALRTQGEMRRILWVRFNPDQFMIEGIKRKVSKEDKMAKLVSFLQSYQPTLDVEIAYLFYSTTDGKPTIMSDPDFPDSIKSLVTRVVVS